MNILKKNNIVTIKKVVMINKIIAIKFSKPIKLFYSKSELKY